MKIATRLALLAAIIMAASGCLTSCRIGEEYAQVPLSGTGHCDSPHEFLARVEAMIGSNESVSVIQSYPMAPKANRMDCIIAVFGDPGTKYKLFTSGEADMIRRLAREVEKRLQANTFRMVARPANNWSEWRKI